MRWILTAMMAFCSLSGAVVLFVSLRELARRMEQRQRFERAEGTIVDYSLKTLSSLNSPRSKAVVMRFPIITFCNHAGVNVTFTSEIGDSGSRSRYAVGQQIRVRYHRDEAFPPMIDSWVGVWLPNVMGMIAGGTFLLGAILCGWLLRQP